MTHSVKHQHTYIVFIQNFLQQHCITLDDQQCPQDECLSLSLSLGSPSLSLLVLSHEFALWALLPLSSSSFSIYMLHDCYIKLSSTCHLTNRADYS